MNMRGKGLEILTPALPAPSPPTVCLPSVYLLPCMWSDLPDLPPLYHIFVYYIVMMKDLWEHVHLLHKSGCCWQQSPLLKEFKHKQQANSQPSSNVRRINFTSQLVQASFPCRCYVLCQALTHTWCMFQLRLGVRAIQQGLPSDIAFYHQYCNFLRFMTLSLSKLPPNPPGWILFKITVAMNQLNFILSKFPALLHYWNANIVGRAASLPAHARAWERG